MPAKDTALRKRILVKGQWLVTASALMVLGVIILVPTWATSIFATISDIPRIAPSHILTGHTGIVNSVAFAPDSQTLASGSEDTTSRLWKVPDGTVLHILEQHVDGVSSVAFSSDGETLASTSWKDTVQFWR